MPSQLGREIAGHAGKDLRAFYAARGNAPLWFDESGRSSSAATLLWLRMRTADRDGLDPAQFDLDNLAKLTDRARRWRSRRRCSRRGRAFFGLRRLREGHARRAACRHALRSPAARADGAEHACNARSRGQGAIARDLRRYDGLDESALCAAAQGARRPAIHAGPEAGHRRQSRPGARDPGHSPGQAHPRRCRQRAAVDVRWRQGGRHDEGRRRQREARRNADDGRLDPLGDRESLLASAQRYHPEGTCAERAQVRCRLSRQARLPGARRLGRRLLRFSTPRRSTGKRCATE